MYAPESCKSSASARSSFARSMMLEQFGKLGHLHDDDWRDHVDIDAKTLAEERARALWKEASS